MRLHAGGYNSRFSCKKFRAGLFSLLVMAGSCLAAGEGQAVAAAGLTCAEPVFRFGKQGPDKTVPHTFVLTNASGQAVQVSAVRAGCGCLAARLATNTVAPGGTVNLEVVMTLAGRKGPQRKLVFVEFNSKSAAPLRLELEGTVVPPIVAQPEGVHFGTLAENGEVEREVMLSASEDNTFQIRNVTCPSSQFGAVFETREAGRKYAVRIRSAGPRSRGTTSASVRVETDHPAMPFLTIPVTVFVAGDIVAAPSSLMLIHGATNTPRTYFIHVYSPAGKPFRIHEVKTEVEGAESRVADLAPGSFRIELRFPAVTPNLNGKQIRIRTDMESTPEIIVPLRVIAKPAK